MAGLVFEPKASTPAELTQRMAAQTKLWAPILRLGMDQAL